MSNVLTAMRWPFAPLLDAAGRPSVDALAGWLGVSPRTIWRWHHRGLTDRQADRAAIALGQHPANIWTDWHHAYTAGPARPAAPRRPPIQRSS
jgi:hypothetical protein